MPRKCKIEGCRRTGTKIGICMVHIALPNAPIDPSYRPYRLCEIEGCLSIGAVKGKCKKHYANAYAALGKGKTGPKSSPICATENCGSLKYGESRFCRKCKLAIKACQEKHYREVKSQTVSKVQPVGTKESPIRWRGSLNMGLRLSAAKKRLARQGDTYIRESEIPGAFK